MLSILLKNIGDDMPDNSEQKVFVLEKESGGVLITATPEGFQAYAKTNVEHMGNSHVMILIRGIMEVLQTTPLILYEAGQTALKRELLEQGVDLNAMQKIPEEAVQKEGYDYTDVVNLENLKVKGNA